LNKETPEGKWGELIKKEVILPSKKKRLREEKKHKRAFLGVTDTDQGGPMLLKKQLLKKGAKLELREGKKGRGGGMG